MTPESVRRLYDYNYWAFDRVWCCIAHLTDEQFREDIPYSMGPIRNHIVHVMSGTRRWMKRLQGDEPSPHLAFIDYATVDATKAKWDELKAEMLAYVRTLDQAQLDERVAWELPNRALMCNNHRWELLLHMANHATDHRAQILAMLHCHFSVETVEQDLIFFLVENQ